MRRADRKSTGPGTGQRGPIKERRYKEKRRGGGEESLPVFLPTNSSFWKI